MALTCCGSQEPPLPQDLPEPTRQLSVLSIGNSFSTDALAYVPYLMLDAAPEIDLTIGILMQSGGALETHVHKITNGLAYIYYEWKRENGYWTTHTLTAQETLALQQWDIVVLQQVSQWSADFTSCQRHLPILLDWLRKQGHTGQIAWLRTPAYADGYYRLTNGQVTINGTPAQLTSDEMSQAIDQCAEQVMAAYPIDLLLPCGNAIQLARHTTLGQTGNSGGLTADGYHLQDGIGRYTEACVVAQTLLPPGKTLGDIRVLDSWRVPDPHSSVTNMSPEEQALARQCAAQASLQP